MQHKKVKDRLLWAEIFMYLSVILVIAVMILVYIEVSAFLDVVEQDGLKSVLNDVWEGKQK